MAERPAEEFPNGAGLLGTLHHCTLAAAGDGHEPEFISEVMAAKSGCGGVGAGYRRNLRIYPSNALAWSVSTFVFHPSLVSRSSSTKPRR